MTDNHWSTRAALELDVAAAFVYVEKPERAVRQGGRRLAFSSEVWWEPPDGVGYRRSVYSPESLPGDDFVPAG
ncbi:hypothetical protein [Kutzneria buriramensis]|uniref:Uncharacterized protein n=1 Tax=Kutzneria buriramensis TaxID=1045776 RepID=A0A3E0HU38_9PSEU|nr:hypothetical protein [Kutzneria buriramensis]REH50062.1 hypothetical protein BCF44_104330 [Kutzneria buriramensis]